MVILPKFYSQYCIYFVSVNTYWYFKYEQHFYFLKLLLCKSAVCVCFNLCGSGQKCTFPGVSTSRGIEGLQISYLALVIKKYNYSRILMKLMFKSCHNLKVSFWLLPIEYYVKGKLKHIYILHQIVYESHFQGQICDQLRPCTKGISFIN